MLNRCIISHTAYGPALTHKNRKCMPKRCAGFRHFGEVNYSYPRPVVHCERLSSILGKHNLSECQRRNVWCDTGTKSWFVKMCIDLLQCESFLFNNQHPCFDKPLYPCDLQGTHHSACGRLQLYNWMTILEKFISTKQYKAILPHDDVIRDIISINLCMLWYESIYSWQLGHIL